MYGQEDEVTQMVRQYTTLGVEVLNTLKGPLGDLMRAMTNAQVDGYIDARERFISAGWPEDLADTAILALIQRNIEIGKQMVEAMRQAQVQAQARKA